MRYSPFTATALLAALSVSIAVPADSVQLYSPSGSEKLAHGARSWLSHKGPLDEVKIWVFFSDKGVLTQDEYRKAVRDRESALSDRTKARRLKARAGRDIVDFFDLPVNQPYVERIEQLGARVLARSRWLNGVSVSVSAGLIPEIERLPFVREIRKVVAYRKERGLRTEKGRGFAPPRKTPLYIDYGVSWDQLEQLNVPEAHANGYTGQGVLICMLDTGFDYMYGPHKSLLHIKNQVVAQWDFINNDPVTWYDSENDTIDARDKEQPYHGTRMLSIVAGYLNNQLIGPAFGADFALCKTEWYRDGGEDIIAEEHWWIAASEWADSVADTLGYDRVIISSSLGYRTWEDSTAYGYLNLDGNTTPLSIGADIAASRGILVVTAIGNVTLGNPSTRPDTCIKAPADADSIIAVGGVDTAGAWAWNPDPGTGSAIGPTADGRTKPELMAAWVCVVAHPGGGDYVDSLQAVGGTSCATALVSGVSALVWEACSSWTNMEVREALLETASNHESPNDTLGWGIPDVWKAIYSRGEPDVPPFGEDELMDPYPNPFDPGAHSEVCFPYRLINETYPFLRIYTVSGELVKEFDLGRLMPGRYVWEGTGAVTWNGHNEGGDLVGSGVYLCVLSTGYNITVKKLAVVR